MEKTPQQQNTDVYLQARHTDSFANQQHPSAHSTEETTTNVDITTSKYQATPATGHKTMQPPADTFVQSL